MEKSDLLIRLEAEQEKIQALGAKIEALSNDVSEFRQDVDKFSSGVDQLTERIDNVQEMIDEVLENKRKVRIKTWEEMEEEFGLEDCEVEIIRVKYDWTRIMEDTIPEDRVIEVKNKGGFMRWENRDYGYSISDDMIAEWL